MPDNFMKMKKNSVRIENFFKNFSQILYADPNKFNTKTIKTETNGKKIEDIKNIYNHTFNLGVGNLKGNFYGTLNNNDKKIK